MGRGTAKKAAKNAYYTFPFLPSKIHSRHSLIRILIALVSPSFRFKLIPYIYFVYVHNGRGHVGATFSPWKSEDNLQGLVLFLHRVVFGIMITLGASAFIH